MRHHWVSFGVAFCALAAGTAMAWRLSNRTDADRTAELDRALERHDLRPTVGAAELRAEPSLGTLVFDSDDARPDNGARVVSYEATFTAGRPEVEVRRKDSAFAVSLSAAGGSMGAATAQGSMVTYRDPRSRVAAVYCPTSEGVKEDIVVLTPDDLAQAPLAWSLKLPRELEARPETDGSIGIYGPDPTLSSKSQIGVEKARRLYTIPAPVIKESNGQTRRDLARFELSPGKLFVRLGAGTDALRYPISIDPSILVTTTADFQASGNNEGLVSIAGDQVTRDALKSGRVGTWAATSPFATGRYQHASVAYNGFIYLTGGASGVSLNDVQYATINADGTVAPWVSTMAFTTPRYGHQVVAYNGYLYILGGFNGSTLFNDVQVARINVDGSVGTWTTTSAFSLPRYGHRVVAHNGYLYLTGGETPAKQNDTQYAAVNADGTLGAWATTTTFATARYFHTSVAYNGYLYVLGGAIVAGSANDVQYAKINADGTVGAYAASTSFPGVRHGHASVASNGFLYVMGGYDAVALKNDVLMAPIQPDGAVGAWTGIASFATPRYGLTPAVYNGYLYLLGGESAGGTLNNDVQYAPIQGLGAVDPWSTSTTFTTTRDGTRSVAYNGYLYVSGGAANGQSSTLLADVQFAPLNPDGTTGAWAAASSFTTARYQHALTAYNGYLYISGGATSSGPPFLADVQFAQINTDGTLGIWAPTTPLPVEAVSHTMEARNGFLYVIGGSNNLATVPDVRYAPINPNGTLGLWTSTTSLPAARGDHASVVYGDRLYVLGAPTPPMSTEVLWAPFNPDGTLGAAWTPTTSMTSGRNAFGAEAINGYLYVFGGVSGGPIVNTIDYAPINANGSLGTWTPATPLTNDRASFGKAAHNGFIYVVGGGGVGPTTHNAALFARATPLGAVGAWTPTTVLTGVRRGLSSVGNGGYLYAVGGFDGATYLGNVEYAAIAADGGIGAWTPTTALTPGREDPETQIHNGYIYVVGGKDSAGTYRSDVQYALVNPIGTVGAWAPTSGFTSARYRHATAVYNGKVYVMGGWTDTFPSTMGDVQFAAINPDGTLAPWGATTALPMPLFSLAAAAYNGRLYVMGGTDNAGTVRDEVWHTAINADGTLGPTWTKAANLPQGRAEHSAAAIDGFLYIVGGAGNPGGVQLRDISRAPINADGSLGSWSGTTGITTGRSEHAFAVHNGRAYVLGGFSGGALNDVQHAPLLGPTAKGYYSKLVDLGADTTVNSITINGNAANKGAVRLQYRLAPTALAAFGPETVVSNVTLGTPVAVSTSARYVWVRLTLDDTKALAINPDATNARDVTDIDISYADSTPPIAGTVNDGTGTDLRVQVSQTSISANWSGFSDPDSGISGYEWAIGTTPGGTDVQVFTSVGLATSATNSALTLTPGTTYYVTVRATNGATLTTTVTSSGVFLTGRWVSAASLSGGRVGHTATLLPDGRVLVAGGTPDNGVTTLSTCEIYDARTGAWSLAVPMGAARRFHSATLLADGRVLVLGGRDAAGVLSTCELYDPVAGSWSSATPLAAGRFLHTATMLVDGKILAVGGSANVASTVMVSTCELYDPAGNSWAPAGSLATARFQHAAALLPNGSILVAGGAIDSSGSPGLATCELYNGAWGPTGSLAQGRNQLAATLLPDGRVLAAGGLNPGTGTPTLCELYDPGPGTWSSTGSLANGRYAHTTTLLPDGKVVVTGGSTSTPTWLASCEVFDATSGSWTATSSMATARYVHTATLLPTGRLLIVGGSPDGGATSLPSCELFDASSPSWTSTGALAAGRTDHSATLLPNGKVLVAGGFDLGPLPSCEIYDSTAETWIATGPMFTPRGAHVAALLKDGRVLAAGGSIDGGGTPTALCEIYDPIAGTWNPAASLPEPKKWAGAALLADGRVLLAAGSNSPAGGSVTTTCAIYDPVANSWTPTGSLAGVRDNYTLTLLPDGRVLAAGGAGFGAAALNSCEVYDPVVGTWSPTGSLGTARRQHRTVLLPSGKVLAIGGETNPTGTKTATCELYDPAAGAWSPTGSLAQARNNPGTILLPGGLVVVLGGVGAGVLSGCEVYDPASGTWTTGPQLVTARNGPTATLLTNGRVLVAGGSVPPSAACELLDATAALLGWKPSITTVNGLGASPISVNPGSSLSIVGTRFRGVSEGGGGSTTASNANFPLVQLVSLQRGMGQSGDVEDGARLWTLPATGWAGGTSLNASLPSASETPEGYYLLFVIANGVVGDAKVLRLDSTPPIAGTVNDGTGTDLRVQVSQTSISANWSGFSDPDSGISGYEWAIGTTPGGTDVQVFTSVGLATSATNSALTLTPGTTYYVTVRATNGATLTTTVTSSGVFLTGRWVSAASLSGGRYAHTATLLPNGKVLVAGGNTPTAYLATCEIYDPATGAWTSTNPLAQIRASHTATLLPDGKVLVAGGTDGTSVLSSCELYDPVTGTWSFTTGPLATARQLHTATLLINAKVLVVSGSANAGSTASVGACEIYDPAFGTWSPAGTLATARLQHAAALLANGNVIVGGGSVNATGSPGLTSCELYDASLGTWGLTGSLAQGRNSLAATLLPDGRVLAAGGLNPGTGTPTLCELYDPGPGTWSSTGLLATGRYAHTATLLPDGKVVVTGGSTGTPTYLASCEVFDPASDAWTATSSMATSRYGHTATLLPSGSVLIVGGSPDGGATALPSCELFDASSPSWTGAGALALPRQNHTQTLLPDGRVLAVGGRNSITSETYPTCSLFDPALESWAPTGSMSTPRSGHRTVLLADGRVLVTGGFDAGGFFLTSCELYNPASGAWTATGSFATARVEHGIVVLANGFVLAVGGYSGGDLASCELYNPATGLWTPANGMAGARRNPSITLLPDGRVLAATGQPHTTACEVYDPLTGLWSATGPNSQARNSSGVAVLPGGKVLISGGDPTGGVPSAVCDIFDPATNSFSPTASLGVARWYVSSTPVLPGGTVLIAGGGQFGVSTASVEIYDPATSTWRSGPPLSIQRVGHGMTLLRDGRVLAAGGSTISGVPGGTLATSEVFDLTGAQTSWKPLINSVNGSAAPIVQVSSGSSLSMTGVRLRGVSNTDFPIVMLTSMSRSCSDYDTQTSGRRWMLPAAGWATGTAFTAALPPAGETPEGQYLLWVIVGGIPGEARTLRLGEPPVAGIVNDGLGADIDSQAATTTISANWAGFSDAGSGIAGYEWAIGTTPGGTQIQALTSVGLSTSATATVTLTSGTTYFVTVRATDGSGLTVTATSDGVQVDTSPPVAGTVNDGTGVDIDAQASNTTISANWTGFSDPEYKTPVHSQGFSSDPSFTLASPPQAGDAYSWDSAAGVYSVRLAETVASETKFALSAPFTRVASNDFVFRVDVKPVTVSFGMGIGLLLYDSSLGFANSINQGKYVQIHHTGSDNPLFAIYDGNGTTYTSTAPALGTWYTVTIAYTRLTGTADILIKETGSGLVFYQQNSVPFNPVSFDSLAYGASTGGGDGTTAEMHYDNAVISQSDLLTYEWAIGTTPGGTDVQIYTAVGAATNATNPLLSLANGTTCFASVRATNGAGLQTIATSDGVTVIFTAPGPTFAPPSGAQSPARIDFTCDLPGAVLYQWDFDFTGTFAADYSSPSSGTVSHTYTLSGTYQARVRVTFQDGTASVFDLIVTIAPPAVAPSVSLSASATTGTCPLTVTFTATLSPSFGRIEALEWDFDGNGSVDYVSTTSNTATYTYSLPGSFNCRLRVTDTAGISGAASSVIATTPGIDPPVITGITATPSVTQPGQPVAFVCTANAGSVGTITRYEWDFDGDGDDDFASTTSGNATYVYPEPGIYTARVRVTELDGLAIEGTTDVTVEPPTVLRVWWSQPRNLETVSGNAVTLHANTAPGNLTARVEFYYRLSDGFPHPAPGDASWVRIGQSVPPPFSFFSVTWDTTLLAPGNYDLLAVATSTTGAVVDNRAQGELTVAVTGTPGANDTVQSTTMSVKPVNPDEDHTSAISGEIEVDLEEQGVQGAITPPTLTIEDLPDDPQSTQTASQGLSFGRGYYSRVALSGGTLGKPARMVMYYRDDNNDGIEDETKIPAEELKVYRYDTADGKWEELLDTTVDPADKRVISRTPAFSSFALGGRARPAASGSDDPSSCLGSVAATSPANSTLLWLMAALLLATARRGRVECKRGRKGGTA